MRPLTLHVSALNDHEYDIYTTFFQDIVDSDEEQVKTTHDDAYYESTSVGVRETRAWLRGRYTDLAAADIDNILKLFSPTLGKEDSLNGGQFFAALRLLMHVRSGAHVDRNLVFIQAHPDTHPSRPQSPPSRAAQPVIPPRPPPSRRTTSYFAPLPTRSDPEPPDLPSPDAPPLPPPIAHKRSVSSSTAPPLPSKNPFFSRSKTDLSVHKLAPPPTASASQPAKSPPLPPRKPASLQPPPRHMSVSSAPEYATTRKPPPPVPSTSSTPFSALTSKTTSLISPLIQTSLQASKAASLSRKAEEQRERERVMHVLKSSSTASITERPRSSSPGNFFPTSVSTPARIGNGKAPTPPERKSSSPPRPPSSTGSIKSSGRTITQNTFPFASSNSPPDTNPFRARAASKSRSPNRREVSPPPTHPDRKAPLAPIPGSPISPDSVRLGRSKSLHHPATPTPPVPPRRRRPESVQLTPSSSTDGSPAALSGLSSRPPHSASLGGSLSRHLSLSSPRSGADGAHARERSPVHSPVAHLTKRFVDLSTRAQPKLEAALFKAEAGITRRGYVPHARGRDGARLMDDASVESVDDSDLDQDREDGPSGLGAGRGMVTDAAPNGTWPVNEGWRRL